jgi:hypothetical protein
MARRPNMRSLYRVDLGEMPTAAEKRRRQLGFVTDMSMPIDAEFSMPIDAEFSMPIVDSAFSFPLDTDMSLPVDAELSMPFTCDNTFDCPASCDCGGMVADASEALCGCYSISYVPPPFDASAVPPSGSWYCYQVDLDKTVAGCSGAKAVSHAVLATGFSESCLFHPGGLDVGGSDDWFAQTCDNTAATGLKYDFGHSGDGDQLSVTYCFDVSCEAAPVGEGSINWVLKSGNDRCEIEVVGAPGAPVPNCGTSSDLCSPSCPAGDGGNNNNGGGGGNNGGGGGNNGGGNKVEEPENQTPARHLSRPARDQKNLGSIIGPIAAVAAVAAIAGVVYLKHKAGAAAAGADGASLSSADTP